MSRRTAIVLLTVICAAALGLLAARFVFKTSAPPALPAPQAITLLPSPRTLPAFSLQQDDGSALTPDTLKGHWTVVFLGYTHCPDICPTTLAQLSAAQKQWQALPAASRPRVLFVSADPERDTPELVTRYARAFHPDSLAATAPVPELERFARTLSLVFMKSPDPDGSPDYAIDHSAALVLLDTQARMAGVAQPPFDVPGIAADLSALTPKHP